MAYADYGTTGVNNETVALLPTRDYGFALRVPIFDGGRRDARRAETASQFRQERVRTNDLHEQIELDVRMALDSLNSAEEQVTVAEAGLSLAQSEFTQARRRFEAGVASSLEVTDAQTRLERARDNRIAALFNHSVARFDLGQATGTIMAMVQREPSGQSQPVMTQPKASTGNAVPPSNAISEPIAPPPPILTARFEQPRLPEAFTAVLAAPPPASTAAMTIRSARPVHKATIRKAAARRPAHRSAHRHLAARKTRRATKAA